jgi:hypothetical protein
MAAVTEASLDQGSRQIVQRYFLAMAAPFVIDLGTSAIYVLINAQPLTLLPMAAVSAAFLLLGVGVGAWLLIRPVQRFLANELTFAEIEGGLAALPRNSAIVVGCLYTPMLALRLLSPQMGFTFGATIEVAAWTTPSAPSSSGAPSTSCWPTSSSAPISTSSANSSSAPAA